jgi:hypothetical protein
MRLPLESGKSKKADEKPGRAAASQIEKRSTTMKNQIRNFAIGAGLAALTLSPSLMAQDRETAEIPFAFHAGESTLPAGTYSVTKASTGILALRNEDTRHAILLGPQGRETGKDAPQLSFRCYSGDCFLSVVWMPGDSGYSFMKTRREKEMESGAQVAMAYVPLATR